MDDYPFGRFLISGGIAMAVCAAYALFAVDYVEALVGENVSPYLVFVLIGVLVIAVGFFNDRFKANVTVPVGVIGWVITLIILFVHYSR